MFLFCLFLSISAGIGTNSIAKEVDVHGHRGSRGLFPENTLVAFRSALEAGVDVLEMDLAVTKDGVLVISHDPHINPAICLNSDGSLIKSSPLIHSLTLSQVKEYDCGALKNPNFIRQIQAPGERIPTLLEVFELVKSAKISNAKKVKFNIEIKVFKNHPEYTIAPEEFAKKAISVFKESGFINRIIFQSFDLRALIEARKLNSTLQIALLVEDAQVDMLRVAKAAGANIISPMFELLTKENIAGFHKAGFQVIPWTLNTQEEWQKAVAMKVDGIITDYPADLLNFKKRMSILDKCQFVSCLEPERL